MSYMRRLLTLVVMGCACLAVGAAIAQDKFPTKPIRILVGFGPGSGTDLLARDIAQKMADNWGQSVVVDNRPGAASVIASTLLVRSPPDGHTLMVVTVGHAFAASYIRKLPYDTLKDFSGVTLVVDIPNVLVVAPALKINSMRELIDLVRSRPGQMNYSSGGIGGAAHIIGELCNQAAGTKALHIPYKSTPDSLMNTISGNVQFGFPSITAAGALVKSKRLVALAVSTKNRSPALPDVPPMAEAGLPGFDFAVWYGLLAPAKTPKAAKDALSKEVARILALPDVRERLLVQGATPRPSTPDEFDALIRQDVARMAKLIRDAGIAQE